MIIVTLISIYVCLSKITPKALGNNECYDL